MRPPIPSITLSRRAKIGIWTAVVLIALIVAVVQLSGVYINFLWFHSLGFGGVYATVFWTRAVLFAIFGVLMALILGGNMVIAYLLSPPFRPMSPEQQNIERYRTVLEPRRVLILTVVSVIALFSAGLSAQGNWATWQLFLHGGSFGKVDPQFHLDISFYAFDYPAYRLLLGFGFTAIVFAIILSTIVHYLTGAIRLQTPGPKVTVAARRHLTLLVFVFVVLKAVAYWLDRYGLVFSDRSVFTGASYTDVHAVLPARTILFWIALIIAAGLIASLWLHNTMLPAIAFVSMLVLSILISGIYPAILQGVSVKPNAQNKEAPYIERNIQYTRAAYNIASGKGGTVTYHTYPVTGRPNATDAEPGVSNATLNNIRILDPNIVSPTFAKFQAQGNQFGFAPKLDIDRYTVNGVEHDYIVGVRELDAAGLSGDQTNWINLHTTYTHGVGFVAADAGSNVTDPAVAGFSEAGIPPHGFLGNTFTQDQAYYGELLPDYSIVGGAGPKQEFNGVGAPKVSYAGGGGVSLGSVFTRLAFAINYKQSNFLLNDAASAPGAHIIFNRDPRVMVQKLAPFLKADSDPYPIVDTGVGNPAGTVDPSKGHIVWMVDGYTTTDNYPYSARESLSQLTNDSLAASNKTAKQPNDQINYIRNSVKATIDAYTGKVTLYAWDPNDPMLKAWRQVFPGLVKDASQMPQSIRAHVRYPQDLFKAQRTLLGSYHVSNPQQFYNASRIWTVPEDNTDSTVNANQPPYYILASPPTGSGNQAQFQLTSPMNVNQASYLAAYISADSDPAHYGQITVLQLPTQTNQVQGPEQAYNTITTDNTVRRDSLFNTSTNGANVVHGNLLTLPLGKSFLYAEPLYTISSNTSGAYPSLQRVILVYGSKIGYGKTVADARSDFLPGHCTGETLGLCSSSGSSQGGNKSGNGATGGSSSPPPPSTTPPQGSQVTLQQIDKAIQNLKDAYATGDPVQVGKAEAALQRLIERYQPASGSSDAPKSGSASSPSAPASGSGHSS